jgi:hypothetical protein
VFDVSAVLVIDVHQDSVWKLAYAFVTYRTVTGFLGTNGAVQH